MKYLSYQLYSQLCVSTIHVSCVYAAIATRRVVRARAGGSPVLGHVCVCVCGGSNVGHSLSTIALGGRCWRAVQCSAFADITVCVALPAACDVALWATAAQRCDLDNLSDGGR